MRRTLGFAAPALLALAACGGGDGGGFSIRGSLDELPASLDDDGLVVSIADLDAATELSELERPDDVDDLDDLIDWIGPLTGSAPDDAAPVFVVLPETIGLRNGLDQEGLADALGWSIADVSTFVEASAPPTRLAVLTGDLGGATEGDELDEEDGIFTAGDGDDLEPDADDTSFEVLGRPVHQSLDGGRLGVSLERDLVEDWLGGDVETLADDERYAGAAAALDAAGAVSAVLLPVDVDDTDTEVVGIGWSVDDGDPVVTVAYAFDEDDEAEDAADELDEAFEGDSLRTNEPLSELVEVERIEVDGAVVAVTLTVEDDLGPSVVFRMLQNLDLPIV